MMDSTKSNQLFHDNGWYNQMHFYGSNGKWKLIASHKNGIDEFKNDALDEYKSMHREEVKRLFNAGKIWLEEKKQQ